MARDRYSTVAITLHWAIALLLLAQIAGGFYMHNLPNSAPAKFDLYQLHKSFGLSILALTLFRLGWRLMHKPPAMPATTPAWQRISARATHWVFYILLLATPLAGLAIVSVSPKEIPTEFFELVPVPHLSFLDPGADAAAREHDFIELHEMLSFAILGLLALHVAAALKHGFWARDGVLRSMAPTSAAVMGMLVIFAGLAAGALSYLVRRNSVPRPAVEAVNIDAPQGAVANGPCGAGFAANWDVDKEKSVLRFIGEENGSAFEGVFTNFDVEVAFDEADLAHSWIRVAVITASAATGDQLMDTTLPGGDWFDVSAHPLATFHACNIRRTGEGAYTAHGALTIKDGAREIDLSFSLDVNGDTATASGGVELMRTEFDLGAASSWLEEEGVALKVLVDFKLEAGRMD